MDITTTIGNCVWPVKKTWHVGGSMGAGTGGAGWASAHPGKNLGGHGPPWKF